MSLFVDHKGRRKSPVVLLAFVCGLVFLAVFGVCYALLTEPLYHAVRLGSEAASTVVHAAVMSVVGTAVCCLGFFLPDKRLVPYGFVCLAVLLAAVNAAALVFLEGDAQAVMLRLAALYGLGPVLVGNAAAWSVYRVLKKTHPVPKRRTLREELKAGAAQRKDKLARDAGVKSLAAAEKSAETSASQAATTAPKPAPAAEKTIEKPAAKTPQPAPAEEPRQTPPPAPGNTVFGPVEQVEDRRNGRSQQDEAMLFYMDDDEDDEESDD